MYVLENRWHSHSDEGAREGTTLVRKPDEATARATRAMIVSEIRVRGVVKNARVVLGTETFEAPVGVTALDPPRKIEKGEALDIVMAGNGSVELVGRRIGKYERTEDHHV